jgi:hypothetical protein
MYECSQVHFCQETGDGVWINTPQIALEKVGTLLMGQTLACTNSEKSPCSANKKVATATGRVENSYLCKIIVRDVTTSIQDLFN